jgi:hypothetical protein
MVKLLCERVSQREEWCGVCPYCTDCSAPTLLRPAYSSLPIKFLCPHWQSSVVAWPKPVKGRCMRPFRSPARTAGHVTSRDHANQKCGGSSPHWEDRSRRPIKSTGALWTVALWPHWHSIVRSRRILLAAVTMGGSVLGRVGGTGALLTGFRYPSIALSGLTFQPS